MDRIKELIKYKGFQVKYCLNISYRPTNRMCCYSKNYYSGSKFLYLSYAQVAPAELEGILLTHPSVEDAAVVG